MEIDSPKPVPFPGGFVVKKGSTILPMFSLSIPLPVSLISTITEPLERRVVIEYIQKDLMQFSRVS